VGGSGKTPGRSLQSMSSRTSRRRIAGRSTRSSLTSDVSSSFWCLRRAEARGAMPFAARRARTMTLLARCRAGPAGYGKHCVGSCTRGSPCFLSLATRRRWVASFLVTCGVNCTRIVFDIQRSDTLLSRSRTISLFGAGAEHDLHTLLFYVGVHKVTLDLMDVRCCP
jgi:hypothetical protein